MKQGMRAVVLTIAAGAIIGALEAPAQTRGGMPSVSVRPPDSRTLRGAAAGLLGWRVGVPAAAFRQLTFSEAAGKADALGLAFIEGSSTQRVSQEISKNLDYNLSPDEIAKVKNRLGELRLRMVAYRADSIGSDESSRRKIFEFAKGLGVETIICAPDLASLPGLDKLASEFGVDVAVENSSLKSMMSALEGRGPRIGVNADIGKWMQEGIKPAEGLSLAKDRAIAVTLRDRSALGGKGRDVALGSGAAGVTEFLLAMSRLHPPAAPEWPPKCTNCSAPRVASKPMFLAIDTSGAADPSADLARSIEAFEKAVRPAMGFRVNEIARKTPITSIDGVPAVERQKIEAALPRQAVVKPKKPRKLLVIDLCPDGGYYHATIAHANLALQLMAKQTGAYEPVFSNDLDNLKYPKIKQYDAVFLNSVVGELFPDPDVMNGLMRFVREGGGLAGIHGSTYASMDLPEYGDLIGAQDGPHQVETATLKIDDPNSPLTKEFGGKGFVREDEFYHFLPTGPYSREKLHVLISIDTEKSDMSRWKVRPDNDYGMTWIKSYGKGRVFNCAMGHTPTLFATPALAAHILAAIQFVLGDLDADTTPSAKVTAKK